jgi:hypothetical protein
MAAHLFSGAQKIPDTWRSDVRAGRQDIRKTGRKIRETPESNMAAKRSVFLAKTGITGENPLEFTVSGPISILSDLPKINCRIHV